MIRVSLWLDRHAIFLLAAPSAAEKRVAPVIGNTALQEPGEDEHPIIASIDARPHDIVEITVAKLGIPTKGR